jgi:hypothetical protein
VTKIFFTNPRLPSTRPSAKYRTRKHEAAPRKRNQKNSRHPDDLALWTGSMPPGIRSPR